MEDQELLSPEVEATIVEALESFDQAVAEARINDDPIRLILLALSGFLQAQRRLYVDGALTLGRELREARGPLVDGDDVRRGVLQGVAGHTARMVQVMTWRNWMAGVATLFVVLMVGAVGGYLFHGAAPVLAGVHAGEEQCEDRADGSRLCWIPVWERLPPATP